MTVHITHDTAAEVGKRVRSTSLYHSRQCGIVLKPRSCVEFRGGLPASGALRIALSFSLSVCVSVCRLGACI